MSHRVVFTDPHQHEFNDAVLDLLRKADVELECRLCESEQEVIDFCRDADAVMTSATQISASVIEQMERCQLIARLGIGYDNVDHEAAANKEIPVTNVPGFCTAEVADHTIALLLACARKIPRLDNEIRQGIWQQGHVLPARRLSTQCLGLVGYGAIGRAVAERAQALGMQVAYFDPFAPDSSDMVNVEDFDSLEDLLAAADIVSLHLPLTADTQQSFSRSAFAAMRPGAILINTSRGGVVDEAALIEALESGKLSAAGLDVLEQEPPDTANPLLRMTNVVMTPHCAAHTSEAMEELRQRAAEEVVRALHNEPLKHIVNGISFP